MGNRLKISTRFLALFLLGKVRFLSLTDFKSEKFRGNLKNSRLGKWEIPYYVLDSFHHGT
jgi:hypothetical protein